MIDLTRKQDLIPDKLSAEEMDTFNRLGYVVVTKTGVSVQDVDVLQTNQQQKKVHTIPTPHRGIKAVVSMVMETPTVIGELKTANYHLTKFEE